MAKQGESKVQKKIRDKLEREVGGWWFKMWGGPFTPAGIPDLIGCVHGLFFALEVKLPNKKSSKASDIQNATIARIVLRGGGVATVVRTPEEALYVVHKALAEAAGGARLRAVAGRSRAYLRAAYGENVHYLGSHRATHEPELLRGDRHSA